jgi:hypothetical protein
MIGKISGLTELAAGGFGLNAIIDSAVNAGESVYQLSTKLGIGASEAIHLSRILKITGGDSESFAGAMTRLDKNFSESSKGGEKTRAVLSAFGVSLTDNSGKLLPLNQQLAELSRGYKLAEANGVQQEFVMNTLGVRGMALVKTLKDYDEAAQNASKVKGVGLDPQQMHQLKQELDIVKMETGQLGMAFTGALAPIAQEIFPPIMSGLSNTATFLAENKSGVIALTKATLEIVVAYKTIKALSLVGGKIGNAWQTAAAQANASMAATGTATAKLTAAQEKAITRAVADSNKGYAQMTAAAIKSAHAQGLAGQELADFIGKTHVQMSETAAKMATSIRNSMTATYLQGSVAATEYAEIANKSLTSTSVVAAETSAVKTAVITESAETCTAVVAESSAAQVKSIATVGEAAVISGREAIAANETIAATARVATVAERELAVATTITGNAAVVAGEKAVGAMAVARVAATELLASVYALAGGWLGVAIAATYAMYQLHGYMRDEEELEAAEARAKKHAPRGSLVYSRTEWVLGPKQTDVVFNDAVGEQREQQTKSSYWNSYVDQAKERGEWEQQRAEADEIKRKTQEIMSSFGNGGNITGIKTGGSVLGRKSEAEKEFEKLGGAANRINEEILKEYNSFNDSKIDAVNRWYDDEKRKLDESKSGNTAYNAALTQLNAVKNEKLRKANAEMLSASTNIWLDAARDMRSFNNLISTAGLDGPTKDLLEMQNRYNDALAETEAKYKRLSVTFMNMDKKSQIQFIEANPGITVNDDGTLNYTKRFASEQLALKENYELQLKKYHADEKQYEYDLDQVMQSRSLSQLATFLKSKEANEARYRAGQTAAMSEYTDLWEKANHTIYDDAATLMGDIYSGLENVFERFAHGTASAADVFKGFANSVIDSLIKIQAQAAAASITSGIGGLFAGGIQLNGARPAGVLGPTDANGGFYKKSRGGPIFGPGTGTSDSIWARVSNGEYVIQSASVQKYGRGIFDSINEGKWPAFAMGGLVTTGATLDSLSSNRVVSTSGTRSSAPNVQINIVNNTGSEIEAETTNVRMDGENVVCDMVLNKIIRNPVFAKNMRMAMGV